MVVAGKPLMGHPLDLVRKNHNLNHRMMGGGSRYCDMMKENPPNH